MACWLVLFYMCKTHGRQFGSDSLKRHRIAITKFAHAQIFDRYAILLNLNPIFFRQIAGAHLILCWREVPCE